MCLQDNRVWWFMASGGLWRRLNPLQMNIVSIKKKPYQSIDIIIAYIPMRDFSLINSDIYILSLLHIIHVVFPSFKKILRKMFEKDRKIIPRAMSYKFLSLSWKFRFSESSPGEALVFVWLAFSVSHLGLERLSRVSLFAVIGRSISRMSFACLFPKLCQMS